MADPVVEDLKAVGDEVPVEIKAGEKPPETVSYSKYIGVTRKFDRVEGELNTKIKGLEEQIKEGASAEEHGKIVQELETTKTSLQTISDELKTTKEATLSEKRAALTKQGISEDEAKGMSEEQINGAIKVLAAHKPKPDMGGGSGADTPAKGIEKVSRGFEALHPSSK